MKTTAKITTDHLIIRPTTFDDLDTFYEWETWPEVTEFFSIRAGQTREEVYQKFFSDDADDSSMQFTICLKGAASADPDEAAARPGLDEAAARPAEGGTPVGRIVLADVIPGWKAEVWRIYIADTALRGKGLGKEALTAVLRYGFETLDLQRIYLDFYTGNPAEYLYRSVGFTEEGVLRGNCRKDGVLHDVHLMSMMRPEWDEIYGI